MSEQVPGANTGTNTATGTNTTTTGTTWTSGLDAETQSYITTKGFKEPKDVIESYRNFEKLQGVPKERLLHLPESLEGEGMNAVWDRLGAVKDAKDYTFEMTDTKMGDFFKEAFHKMKVPRPMVEGVMKAFNERQINESKINQSNVDDRITQEHAAIKKEWGAAYEQNENIANQAAAKFGLSKDEVAALGGMMGPAKALKFLHKLGEGIGEIGFVQGNGASNQNLTPIQAQSEIKTLIKDIDFGRRLKAGDLDAKNKWNRLHQFAFQGETSV